MIIDSHCHIDFDEFDTDRHQVLERARQARVEKIIVPGVSRQYWPRIRSCCHQYTQLYPCYGLHPYFIEQHQADDIPALKNWLMDNPCLAIGECGLDYFIKSLDRKSQLFYFEAQLDMALEFDLPVVIHARKSTEDVIGQIRKRKGLKGMIHSYSGSHEQALQLIELGFYLSFGGPVTYPKASRLRKRVAQLPLQNLLLETDAPDQPVARINKNNERPRNEPAFITDVADTIAQLHHCSTEQLAHITSQNAEHLFQFKKNFPA